MFKNLIGRRRYLGKPVYPAGLDCPAGGWRGSTQQASIELVRSAHPDWTEAQLIAQAKSDFQAAASRFMITTMETVKRIRPLATWGFYMFPCLLCNATISFRRLHMNSNCRAYQSQRVLRLDSRNVQRCRYKQHGPCSTIVPRGKRGWVHDVRCGYDDPDWGANVSALYLADWLLPAWSSVDALFPSIYLSAGVPKDLQTAFVNENVHLSLRIAKKVEAARRDTGHNSAEDGAGRPLVLPRRTGRPLVLPFGTLYYHGEFGPSGMLDNHTRSKPVPQMGNLSAACLSSLKALNDSKVAWVGQEQSGLMDDFDVNVQFEASLDAGADGVVLWGGGSQPYLHTDECKEELVAWVDAKLGPAVCAARQNACNSTHA